MTQELEDHRGACYQTSTKPEATETAPAKIGPPDVHGLYRLRRGVEELAKRGLRPVRGNTQIGRALAAIHRDPACDWTLESLARSVAMSRSAFAEQFMRFVGTPAMQYLTNWRMQLAANRLVSTTDSVAVVANGVGYQSEAAFSRAFKKSVGLPPSEWRNGHSQP